MIRVATDDGLVVLDASSPPKREVRFGGRRVLACGGGWAVVEDSVVALDGSAEVAAFDGAVPWCVAPDPSGDAALVGTSKARLFHVGAGGAVSVVDSFDRIPTRDEWYTPWGGPPDTRSVAVTPDGRAMVNVHVGGIWAASEGGWAPLVEVDADVHQVCAAGPGSAGSTVVAAAAIGCGVSLDGGHTWRWSDDGLHASYSRAAAIAGDVVLVTASTGPSTRSGALYRRGLASDAPFERCDRGLPASFPFNLDTFTLAASDSTAVLGTADGRLFLSTDQAASWHLVADDLPPVRAVELI
jgi:hypothetical protein